MKLYLNSKRKTHSAVADYDGKIVTVLKDSIISKDITYSKLPKYILEKRNDASVVSSKGKVLQSVSFDSPTAAAQFVTGRSVNGYIAWRPDNAKSLKQYLEEKSNSVYRSGK